MRTKLDVVRKWEKKIEDMKKKADWKYDIVLQNRKRQVEKSWEYEIEKIERRRKSYINKKETEYRRKMMNEIRELEWKPKREYKTAAPKIKPLEFAMAIAQENSKLRDTDADGNGRCISCDSFCSWENLAWWHRYSRRFKHICLERENINAQCHTCNWTTWPKWDPVAKMKVNEKYDENLDKKFGEWTAAGLRSKVYEYTRGESEPYDLDMVIPILIEENEKLWASKNFYKPKKKWRNIWTKYKNRT